MGLDFGTGVSRTLDAVARQFSAVVWQKGRPPLDSELNLMSQDAWESLSQIVRSQMPSGFFLDPTRTAEDFQFNPNWANLFKLGNPRISTGAYDRGGEKQPIVWAAINGWVIPIVGTGAVEGDLANVIKLMPPPESDSRVDYVFLEAWQTRVDANPSTKNKPSASTIHKYGNVGYGGTNLTDDLEDPTLGYQTTGRIQVQYRLRVQGGGSGMGSSVALDVYPDGLGDSYIYGQGTSSSPVAGLGRFVNMREALGDPSLWRAGDGNPDNDFGTVDGYVYAVPVCAIFRRNSSSYLAVNGSSAATQNGGFNRTPAARFPPNPTARELSTATLTSALDSTSGVSGVVDIDVTNFNGSGLEDPYHVWSSVFLTIDDEIIGVDSVDLVTHRIRIPVGGRGRYGTAAAGHKAGAVIKFYNTRPDGLYSDQIAATDVLDLRHAVNNHDWDFNRLLAHNVAALTKGKLRTAWKLSATGPTQGTVVHEVDYMYAGHGSSAPQDSMPVDGPDGIRTVWSDAATIQPDVTVMCSNNAAQAGNGTVGITNGTFDTTVSWDVGADFHPAGFMNSLGQPKWTDGSTIFLFTGGQTGNEGVRSTFRDSGTRGVRLLTPKEYWKSGYPAVDPLQGSQAPVTLRFTAQRAFEPAPVGILGPSNEARHVGPMSPWRETNFERPFIVLGGVLNDNLKLVIPAVNLVNVSSDIHEIDLGIDFSVPDSWFSVDANNDPENDPKKVANPLFHGLRTLYGMLTDNGHDEQGNSSEVYVVLYGDNVDQQNNGAFKVIGVGPLGASTNTRIRVRPLSPQFLNFNTATGVTNLHVEVRSQYTHPEDVSSYNTKWADVAIVLTDVGGLTEHPWKREYLGYGQPYDLSMPFNGDYPNIDSNLLISTTFQYHPGHGATARVADDLVRFSRVGGIDTDGTYLRQSPASLDPNFHGSTGAPGGANPETFWDANHVQLWNRLPALGWFAPFAPAEGGYGGNVVGFTEQDREHELFMDKGSKTLIFRPFRSREMTLQAMTFADLVSSSSCLMQGYTYPVSHADKDCLGLWTGTPSSGKQMGLAVPREFMPRFGRQDIPYYRNIGGDPMPFLPGINHLFKDVANTSSPVFNIIGGESNLGAGGVVKPLLFLTGINGGAVPYALSGTTDALTNNQPYIGARKTTDIDPHVNYAPDIIAKLAAVNSSDFGRGLRGIQLPPYYGPARVIGVYDAVDFEAMGGHTIAANRIDPESNPAPNLLREDADQQTLFILQHGAKDLTQQDGDHTYIIPENALDLTRALTWNPSTPTDFKDFHFVVVTEVFGFAKGFIDKNNYVMLRKYAGTGALITDSMNQGNMEIPMVPMVIPCPASYNEQFYTAYNRTVYQGDVYLSREGNAMASADYDERYGQLTSAQQYALRTPIEQYDSNGVFVPQTPNLRSFEVLASMDFYTTLGTGKIGGQLYPGTPLDVGFVQNSPDAALRKPDVSDAPMWQVQSRAFTEGQKSSTNRAKLDLAIEEIAVLDSDHDPAGSINNKAWLKFKLLDGTVQQLWFSKSLSRTAMETAYGAENIILVDETVKPREYTGSYTATGATLAPGKHTLLTVPISGVKSGDSVVVDFDIGGSFRDMIQVRGWVPIDDTVNLWVSNSWTPTGFLSLPDGGGESTLPSMLPFTVPFGGPVVPANGIVSLGTMAFPGATTSMGAAAQYLHSYSENGLSFTAEVSAANTVEIFAHNVTTAPIVWGGDTNFHVYVFNSMNLVDYTVPVPSVDIRVLQSPSNGSGGPSWNSTEPFTQTFLQAVQTILQHPQISRSVTLRLEATPTLHMESVATGAEGNKIQLQVGTTDPHNADQIAFALRLSVPHNNEQTYKSFAFPVYSQTRANFAGGVDIPMNAGPGTSQVSLTGMTERLPLGALLQDSDFLCENPLVDNASAMKSSPVGPRPIQSIMPLTNGGEEYTRFMGEPGELLAQSDGAVCVTDFSAWRQSNPTGSRIFRLYRGGGPVFVLSGDNPGGPLDWVSESFPAAITPVLKGGALVCRAMLVRNFYEENKPHAGPILASNGDEIQMVIVTQGVLGDYTIRDKGVTLSGVISPSGYGEGYAASDRFRIAGRPMFKGFNRHVPNPDDVTLAVYPDKQR